MFLGNLIVRSTRGHEAINMCGMEGKEFLNYITNERRVDDGPQEQQVIHLLE